MFADAGRLETNRTANAQRIQVSVDPRCNMILWPRGRGIRFHDPRHCAATLMLRAGVDLHRVNDFSGI
jgi:integrase